MKNYHRHPDTTDKPHHTAYFATVHPSNHSGKQMHAQALMSEYKYACGSDKWDISISRHQNKIRFYMKHNQDYTQVWTVGMLLEERVSEPDKKGWGNIYETYTLSIWPLYIHYTTTRNTISQRAQQTSCQNAYNYYCVALNKSYKWLWHWPWNRSTAPTVDLTDDIYWTRLLHFNGLDLLIYWF